MPVQDVYDLKKKKVDEMELSETVFAAPVKKHLLYDVVRAQLANRRQHARLGRNRAMVRGGGAKPWRQKGTGHARVGTLRSPLWVGGGMIFGEHQANYSLKLNRKVRRAALRAAVSYKRNEERLLVVESFELPEIKTRSFLASLADLGVERGLIITESENLNLELSARNVPGIKVMRVEGLNVFDILKYDHLIMTREAARLAQEALER